MYTNHTKFRHNWMIINRHMINMVVHISNINAKNDKSRIVTAKRPSILICCFLIIWHCVSVMKTIKIICFRILISINASIRQLANFICTRYKAWNLKSNINYLKRHWLPSFYLAGLVFYYVTVHFRDVLV